MYRSMAWILEPLTIKIDLPSYPDEFIVYVKNEFTESCMGRFSLVLEEEFELVVPADTLVYPHDTYNWEYMNKNGFENGLSLDEITPVTMAEFCEKVIDPERCSEHFLIYMEDGVIVKIVEEFSW